MTSDALKYVIVDTDVFSRLFRREDAEQFRAQLTGVIPVLSFVSVAELHFGATMANWGERRRGELAESIRRYVIAPYDEDMARLWQPEGSGAESGTRARRRRADQRSVDLRHCYLP